MYETYDEVFENIEEPEEDELLLDFEEAIELDPKRIKTLSATIDEIRERLYS